ncbi:MAG TPA: PDZ domain-containing protein [Candidatus Coprenecus stercoravium]|uniref:PDZ domain-containing protein n=1 Tax=Candidatus Coprenecus stercoravium TaxID=2840735 RepID=A0A9D2GPL5_9BACT|nr:PDZ domain-containing protein [Candidatus Coprenecus stercoravium]
MKKILRVCIQAVLIISAAAFAASAQSDDMRRAVGKYSQIMYYIDRLYLEEADFENMVDDAVTAAMRNLDPHSSYIPAAEVMAMNEPLRGEFEGIGIEFAVIMDTLTVQATVAGGPSETVGLRAGDKIVQVDTVFIAGNGVSNDDVFRLLRGEKGTKVALRVLRRGVADTLDFSIVRDRIPVNSVDAAYEAADGVLYIKLSRFAARSDEEIRAAFEAFGKIPEGLILDLRGNSGGYLPTAIKIADEFLQSGDMIVYTEGRTVPVMKERASGKGKYRKGPLVIMIDENSASASEIVAGAVQDQDRGTVVGRRSFGKGLVQQALPLDDGSEIRLTIARYHTPSGRVIQSPYENGDVEGYYEDFYNRYQRGESFSRDSIHFPDSLRYRTLKLGRTVYGGGGIMPDVFVPRDTSAYTDSYAAMLRQGIVPEYVNGLCDRKREEWSRKYDTFDKFDSSFKVTSRMMEELMALAAERGIEYDEEDTARSEEDLKTYIKALVAGNILSRDCFYRVINERSPEFQAALDALREASLSSKALL